MTTTSISNWHNSERALPLSLAVSSLFTVGKRSVIGELKDKLILSGSGALICYNGPCLGTDDMDVLMALSHIARGAESSGDTLELHTSFAELLDVLAWPTQISYYERLDGSLLRLSRAHLNLKELGGPSGRRVKKHVFGTLLGVTKVVENEDARERSICTPISKSMLQLWQDMVRVSWTQRRLLKHSLSRWLQVFVVFGEAKNRDYLIDELISMSSFKGEKREFRRLLKTAGDELILAGFLASFTVTKLSVVFVSAINAVGARALPLIGSQGVAARRAAMHTINNQLLLGD